MGPKKRRGRKQSPEVRTVANEAPEAVNLMSGDYIGSEAQKPQEVDGEEALARLLSPVVSDRKLSSAVLVLENCLLPSPQPRSSRTSPSPPDEVQQPAQPGRKRKSLGVRKGTAGMALTEDSGKEVPEDTPKLKQGTVKRQKRQIRQKLPRRIVVSSTVEAVVVDEPNSDVDVESGAAAVVGDGDLEMGTDRAEPYPVDETVTLGAEAFPEKKKRKRAFKKEKHTAKRRRKDDVAVARPDEDTEEIKVDDEEAEDDEEEGESYATWMVSPLSGDEERMIFKRQRRVSPPESETGGAPGQCLVPLPADATSEFQGNVPDSESPVDVDPMEADVQEDVDVELISAKVDEAANADFTAVAVGKGRKFKKKTGSKTTSQSVDQSDLGVEVVGAKGAVGTGGRGRKKKKLAGKKILGVKEVEGSLDLVESPGSRVTRRSQRNGSGGVTEAQGPSDDKQSLGNPAEEMTLPSSGPLMEADSLEGPALKENPTDTNSLEEPTDREIAVVKLVEEGKAEGEAADGKLKNSKKKKKKKARKGRSENTPSCTGSEEDRSSGGTPRLDAAFIRSSDADETPESTPTDGSTGSYPAATCAPVACQPFDQGSSEKSRDAEEASASSNSDNVSSKSPLSGALSDKVDAIPVESAGHVGPAQHVTGDSRVSVADDDSATADQRIPGKTEIDGATSCGTRTPPVQSEKPSEESPDASQATPRTRSVHSNSLSILRFAPEERSDVSGTADVSPLLSLECYSELTGETAAMSDLDRPSDVSKSLFISDACGPKPGDTASFSIDTATSQRKISSATNSDSSKKEKGKLGERVEEGVMSLDVIATDDCLTTNRKGELGVVVGGDDTGFVPLKKRRLRMADGEVPGPEDAATLASSDVQNSVGLVPADIVEMTTIEGQQLGSAVPDLLTLALPCANLVPKANKYVGTHVLSPGDLAGAVLRASQLGARALGIFIKHQRTWTPPPLDPQEATKFKEALKEKGFSPHMVVPHGSYLLNCGASDAEHLSKSRESLVDDLRRCQMLGLPLFNFHPGAYSNSDSVEDCVLRIADSINYVHGKVSDVMTVIENMSGEANSVGSTFDQLKQIIDRVVDKSRIGVCLDTCHAFAAGYDLRDEAGYRKLMDDFDSTIGRQYLKAVHINDSRGDLGSRVDHHASLGKGKIGLTCFQLIMSDRSLENIPLILETPIAGHKQEIEMLYGFI